MPHVEVERPTRAAPALPDLLARCGLQRVESRPDGSPVPPEVTFHLDRLHFVHVPRTGGTTVRAALGIPMREHEHRTAARWLSLAPRQDRARTLLFAVHRNPWDRAVSLCAFLLRGHLARLQRPLAPAMFQTWLAYGLRDGSQREPILHPDTPDAISVCAPQVEYSAGCDVMLSFEDLADELRTIVPCLRGPLPRENESFRQGDYRCYYDDESAELVGRLYRSDVDAFGYTFDP